MSITLPELCDDFMIRIKKVTKLEGTPEGLSDRFEGTYQKIKLDSGLCKGKSLTTPYFTGSAIKELTVADVLFCIIMDSNTFIGCRNLEDFLKEFEYPYEDGVRIWKGLKKSHKKYLKFVPDPYDRQQLLEASLEY